ncbi:coiled-coil domain-containing protein 33 [Rhea pennata]|uniref:coiled-coil domain-containing protein 33 n=1 Tax=Rhea pennata TaxID=8795 RepID=UPI002E269811
MLRYGSGRSTPRINPRRRGYASVKRLERGFFGGCGSCLAHEDAKSARTRGIPGRLRLEREQGESGAPGKAAPATSSEVARRPAGLAAGQRRARSPPSPGEGGGLSGTPAPMAAAAGELRVPTSLQKARLKVEEKTLDFEFEVLNAQFNSRGRYALRLTVENPLLEGAGAGVRLRVNDGEAVRSDAGTTDVVEQSEPDEICSFRRRKFIFTLPRGFCKNDRNHDARLRIEALRVRGPAAESGRRVGEAFFAIYPRPNQPRMNLFAGTDEDLYRYGGVTPLLRAGGDRLARHCGRLAFAAAFHEHRPPSAAERARRAAAGAPPPPPAEGRARSPEARQRQGRLGLQPSETRALCKRRDLALGHLDHLEKLPAGIKAVPEGSSFHLLQPPADPDLSSSPELPGDSADEHLSSSSSSSSSSVLAPRQLLSCSSFHLSSPGYSPDLTSSAVQVAESPAGEEEEEEVARAPEAGRRHVARAGKEVIAVTLHGASNLPAPRAGTAPRPYVLVKTIRDEEQQRKGQVTHASSEPTYSPTWEEEVTVEIDAEDASWEALALTVADGGTKEALATYRLPVRHLRPFHRYHCRLALPRKRDPAGTSLYVTLVRKGSAIPRCAGVGYAGLEVFLEGMTAPLATPPGALVAAARVVAEGRACRGGMAKRPAVGLTAVAFPAPSAADFSPGRGCAQVALGTGWRCDRTSGRISTAALMARRRAAAGLQLAARRPLRPPCAASPSRRGNPALMLTFGELARSPAWARKMTSPAGPPEKPTWNTTFLFQGRDGATIFSEDAALVIEYYPFKAMSDAESALGPLGYSVLPLLPGLYRRLAAEGSRSGVRVDGLAVQGTDLKTVAGAAPTVRLCLRLIGSERPDTFLSPSGSAALPSLDPASLGKLPLGPPGPPAQDEPLRVPVGTPGTSGSYLSAPEEKEKAAAPRLQPFLLINGAIGVGLYEPQGGLRGCWGAAETASLLAGVSFPAPPVSKQLHRVRGEPERAAGAPNPPGGLEWGEPGWKLGQAAWGGRQRRAPLQPEGDARGRGGAGSEGAEPQHPRAPSGPAAVQPHLRVPSSVAQPGEHQRRCRCGPLLWLNIPQTGSCSGSKNPPERLRAPIRASRRERLRPGDASLPPADAVAALLPPQQPSAREPAAPAREQRCPDGAGDQQDQEMNDYRLALERMADEILSLRQHVASLEMENSNLRRSLTMHEDLGRTLLSDVDVDVMTKAEIVDRIGTLKHKLASGTVEMRRLKDRVQQLQNELIRKNDQEKDLVMLQRTHQQQQAVLMRYQEKVAKTKGLEETVKQQEKVIEAMERMLQERLSGAVRSTSKPAGEALAGELYGVLLAENRRLREELARPRPPSPPIVPPPQALPDVFGSSEKLSLLAKLEKAQARSRVLESQLEEAARRWGREKQELSTRLLEQDHGFRGSSSSVAHDPAAVYSHFPPEDATGPHGPHEETPDTRPSALACART